MAIDDDVFLGKGSSTKDWINPTSLTMACKIQLPGRSHQGDCKYYRGFIWPFNHLYIYIYQKVDGIKVDGLYVFLLMSIYIYIYHNPHFEVKSHSNHHM